MDVRPVEDLPVSDLGNRIVGTALRCADGSVLHGILGNIDLQSHNHTEHFVTLTLFRSDGKMFHLARYHHFNYARNSPSACAAFLRMEIKDLFPISYDISNVAIGAPASILREIPTEPKRRLGRDELIRMAIAFAIRTSDS